MERTIEFVEELVKLESERSKTKASTSVWEYEITIRGRKALE